MAFDDHAAMVVIQEVVVELVKSDIERSASSVDRMARWQSWLKQRGALFSEAAFREGTPPEATLVALGIAGEFDEFANSLAAQSD